MDGSDGTYAVKLTSFDALEFIANENTLGNDYVDNNFNNVMIEGIKQDGKCMASDMPKKK